MTSAGAAFLRTCRARSPEVIALRVMSLLVLLLATAPRLPMISADAADYSPWSRLTLCLAGGTVETDENSSARAVTCPACLISCHAAATPVTPAWTPRGSSAESLTYVALAQPQLPPPSPRAANFEPRAPPRSV